MKSIGIIAEYNPFHRGHSRQIAFLKEQGAQIIAVALSGPFVQRGTPAWTDKFLRARMALEQGVDFVFELPILYVLSSAEGFAWGGVSLLNAIPLEGLCFGSECGKLEPLQSIADFLAEQDCRASHPTEYQQQLQHYLKCGQSYPSAREHALSHFFPQLLSEHAGLLSTANNILAIEYLKALKQSGSSMRPLTLARNDSGYHSQQIDGKFSSASAIRHALISSSLEKCRHALPETVYSLLLENPRRYPVQANDFSELFYLRIRQMRSPEEYTHYGNISPELARRIWNLLPGYTDITSFIKKIKTKNYTYSHISRALSCLLLGITSQQLWQQSQQAVPYLRLLGMRQEKSSFLRQVTDIPIITKVANYKHILQAFYESQPENCHIQLDSWERKQTAQPKEESAAKTKQSRLAFALDCFETDLLASDIYRQTMYHKTGYMLPDEYRCGIYTV